MPMIAYRVAAGVSVWHSTRPAAFGVGDLTLDGFLVVFPASVNVRTVAANLRTAAAHGTVNRAGRVALVNTTTLRVEHLTPAEVVSGGNATRSALATSTGTIPCNAGDTLLFTTFTFKGPANARADYFSPDNSVAVRVELGNASTLTKPWGEFTTEGCALIDITDELVDAQRARVDKDVAYLATFLQHVDQPPDVKAFLAPALLESDWVVAGKYMYNPAITGWPAAARLSFNPTVYWPRAVELACIITGCDADVLAGGTAAEQRLCYDILLASTLTWFAGNYPPIPESTDDRGLQSEHLGLDVDCDVRN
jgi:hypothetical protein